MLGVTWRSDWRYLTRHAEEAVERPHDAQKVENYYLDAAEHGEPAGLWWGNGAANLGLSGEVAHDTMDTLYGALAHPGRGESLGTRPRQFASYEERLAKLVAAEIDPPPERLKELELQARGSHREARTYVDLTFSPSKSWSVLHASLEKAGRHGEAEKVWQAWMTGVGAGLEYLEREAGYSRAGYHGAKVAGRTSGRWVDGHDFVVSLWRHHTSRDGDPQLHVHAAVLNRVLNEDGVWRSLDGAAIHRARPAAAAVAERAAEEALTASLGVTFRSRPDGLAREAEGVDPEIMRLFSSRRRAINGGVADLVKAYEERHGKAPSPYVLTLMAEHVTLKTRQRKPEHPPTRQEMLAGWEARSREVLAGGLDAVVAEVDWHRAQGAEPLAFDPDRVVAQALASVQEGRATWTRYDLVAELNRQLPDCLGGLNAEMVTGVLDDLAEKALTGDGEAVKLTAEELVTTPGELRRVDGRSIYEPHNADRYATRSHLEAEERLVALGREVGTPVLTAERVDEMATRHRLSGSQAEAFKQVLTSGKRLEVVVGPAGTGKSYLSAKLAETWESELGLPVIGITTAERARQVLAEEGITNGANVTKFLQTQRWVDRSVIKTRNLIEVLTSKPELSPKQAALLDKLHGRVAEMEAGGLKRGQLVIIDEASMISTADFDEVVDRANKAGAKVLVTGDDHQLSGPGAGGAMRLLTKELGASQLTEVHRFSAEWEREASLRLREGDATVLLEYDRHGRLVEGTAEEMEAAALEAFLADHLDQKRAILVCTTNEQAAQLAGQARQQLVELGFVDDDGVQLHNGTVAGAGDLIQVRKNDRDTTDDGNRGLVNREIYRVVDTDDDNLIVQRQLGRDDFGADRYGSEVILTGDYVAEHVELAYASTIHSAQGRTVDRSHAIVDEQTSREALYVEMTRGRDSNVAYVVSQSVDEHQKDTEPDRETESDRDRLAVLAAILERESVEKSASEVKQEEIEATRRLDRLGPIWADVVAEQAGKQYAEILAEITDERTGQEVTNDDASRALWRQLRSIELSGGDVRATLDTAVRQRELDTAESKAQVLYWRIERTEPVEARPTPPLQTYAQRTPAGEDPVSIYAQEVAALMDERTAELGDKVVAEQPEWSHTLGPIPEDPLDRAEWTSRAGTVAGYREMYGQGTDKDALGRAPSKGSAEARAAWENAYKALGSPEAERPVAGRSNAELNNVLDDYRREESWAPAHVDDQLREASQAARVYEAKAVHERAQGEAKVANDQERQARAQRAADYEELARRTAQRQAKLEEIAEARQLWFDATVEKRELARLAREELSRREATKAAEKAEPAVEPEVKDVPEIEEPAVVEREDRNVEVVDERQREDAPLPRRSHPEKAEEIERDGHAPEKATVAVEAEKPKLDELEAAAQEEVPESEPQRDHDDDLAYEIERARAAVAILAHRQQEQERREADEVERQTIEYERRRDIEQDDREISRTDTDT